MQGAYRFCMTENNLSFAAATEKKKRLSEEKTASGIHCPHCGATIDEDAEICPSCGHRLVSYCTFCGAPMLWSDSECPECGAPSDGIRCPSCGALSMRSFCPKCNAPVTKAAVRMVEIAQKDPVFNQAAARSDKVEELQRKLEEAPETEAVHIKEELIRETNDLNALLDRMLPPAGSTPQEQRNYYCARKVAVKVNVTRRVRIGWVCNYCGATHSNPSECVKPFLGGSWKYDNITLTQTEYIKK